MKYALVVPCCRSPTCLCNLGICDYTLTLVFRIFDDHLLDSATRPHPEFGLGHLRQQLVGRILHIQEDNPEFARHVRKVIRELPHLVLTRPLQFARFHRCRRALGIRRRFGQLERQVVVGWVRVDPGVLV
jgi:hypothetical protein